jgi:hypothetical protein
MPVSLYSILPVEFGMRLQLLGLLGLMVGIAWGQPATGVNCQATAVPTIVRIEGLSERVGDMVLNCSGGAPGRRFGAN